MITRFPKKFSSLFTLLVMALSSLVLTTEAKADGSKSFMNANFAGTTFLNSSRNLQADITPLAYGSDTWRNLNWAWPEVQGTPYGEAHLGVDFFNSGTAHNFVFLVSNAVDIQENTFIDKGVRCERRNEYKIGSKSYFQGLCYARYIPTPGQTFRLSVRNDSQLGASWFKARFENLATGLTIDLPSINVGEKNFSQPLKFTRFLIAEISTPTSCSSVGINDTVIANVRNGSTALDSFSSQSLGSCINGVIVPNKGPAGGQVYKYGGGSPGSRNLEASLGSTNEPTPESTRKARPLGSVPVPSGFLPGLYQSIQAGYFNDNPMYGEGVTPIVKGTTNLSFPRFDGSGFNSPQTLLMNGYFIPDFTGIWRFRIESSDASFMWLGNDAIVKYRDRGSVRALLDNGGIHSARKVEASIYLLKDKVYPIRIAFGSQSAKPVFKFDSIAPGFSQWESDTTSLMWHTEPSWCTTWGIDYATVGALGYDQIPQSQACKDFLSIARPNQRQNTTIRPSFSLVNFSDNKINVNVNLGSDASQISAIYLVAPKLGFIDSNRLVGKITGSIATWSIDFNKALSGTGLPIKIVAIKSGVESEPLEGIFDAPAAVSKILTNASKPLAPKNVKSRVIGTSAFITADSTFKAGAVATRAYIYGSQVGITKTKAISGDIVGNKVLLEVPIKQNMSGKKLLVTVFLANDAGESDPAQTVIAVPGIPVSSFSAPVQKKIPNTVYCMKGEISRTFAALKCPPGWKA